MILTFASFGAFTSVVNAANTYWVGVYNSESPYGKVKLTGEYYDSGWSSSCGTYMDENKEATVDAQPDSSYVFKEWQDESHNVISTQKTYTFTVTAETKLYAIFESASGLPNISTQPTGGSVKIGENFDITYATAFTPDKVELYRGDTVGSGVYEKDLGSTSGTIDARTIQDTVSFYIKFTYSGNSIFSDVFVVNWNNYIITKQPTGGSVKIGEDFDITYATDVTPYKVSLYRGDTVGSGVFEKELGATSGKVDARTIKDTVSFHLKFEDEHGNAVYSNVFTINWNEYVITKQPTGGSVKIGEDFDITYATDVTPHKVSLYRGDTVGSGVFEKELGTTSGTIDARTFKSSVPFHVGFEDAHGNIVYSNVFTVNWEATQHTVSFNTDGGSAVANQTVNNGEKAARPATDPTKDGYTFDGWFTEDGTEFDFDTAITADITVYAKWTEESTEPEEPTAPEVGNTDEPENDDNNAPEVGNTDTPKTGDAGYTALLITIMAVALIGMIGAAAFGKKRIAHK